jgi:arylsulfatase
VPEEVDGIAQLPMDGTSLANSFDDPDAPERHTTQYFEVNGHRPIYSDGWLASTHHGGVPWTVGLPGTPRDFAEDTWELYDLRSDFSQAHDVAAEHPEKLAELQALVTAEAERVGIWLLHDASVSRTRMPRLSEGRTSFTFHAGTVGVPESQAPRLAHHDRGSPGRGRQGDLPATPPAIFSIGETVDIGCTTRSPVGDFPVSFAFWGGTIERVDLELDG